MRELFKKRILKKAKIVSSFTWNIFDFSLVWEIVESESAVQRRS